MVINNSTEALAAIAEMQSTVDDLNVYLATKNADDIDDIVDGLTDLKQAVCDAWKNQVGIFDLA